MKKISSLCAALLLCLLLSGCEQPDSKDISSSTDVSKKDAVGQKESFLQKTNIFYQTELTERESFYLQAFTQNNSLLAYDARWDQNFHTLEYRLYQYENGEWKKQKSNQIELEEEAKEAWLVISSDPGSYGISILQGSTTQSLYDDSPATSEAASYESSTYDALEQKKLTEGEEFAVVAYRRLPASQEDSASASIYDFQYPKDVALAEGEEYFMLTLCFRK